MSAPIILDVTAGDGRVWLRRMLGSRVLDAMPIPRAEWDAFTEQVRSRAGIPCRSCDVPLTNHAGERTDHQAHGYCRRCYKPWVKAGRPGRFRASIHSYAPVADRVEDYLFLSGEGLSHRQIAERLGVNIRSVDRWAVAAAREQAAA